MTNDRIVYVDHAKEVAGADVPLPLLQDVLTLFPLKRVQTVLDQFHRKVDDALHERGHLDDPFLPDVKEYFRQELVAVQQYVDLLKLGHLTAESMVEEFRDRISGYLGEKSEPAASMVPEKKKRGRPRKEQNDGEGSEDLDGKAQADGEGPGVREVDAQEGRREGDEGQGRLLN